jgi:hypothetical protein
MVSQAELDRFFEQLVATVQRSGGRCAITSGMACVYYGVAQATKDCDLLCGADSIGYLWNTLRTTTLRGTGCVYRGHVTPPLHPQWLCGGWTSHFTWDLGDNAAYLDVFTVAPRSSSPWMTEMLPTSPLRDYGLERLVAESKTTAASLLAPGALDWLPEATMNFVGLE